MAIESLLILLLLAGICGVLGQVLTGYSRGGFLFSIGVGFIGALVGRWLANVLGLPEIIPLNVGGYTFPILWAIVGSALLVALFGSIDRRYA